MTPNIFQKGGGAKPLNFGGLHANSSKTVEATDFKFDTRLLRDNTDMTPNIFFQKVGVVRVT